MSNVEVSIEKTSKYYHYETKEKIVKCNKCGREYKRRKYCLDCYKKKGEKVETIEIEKINSGWVTLDLKEYSCSCVFGSWWRFGKSWKENHPNTRCKHAKWAMRKIKE